MRPARGLPGPSVQRGAEDLGNLDASGVGAEEFDARGDSAGLVLPAPGGGHHLLEQAGALDEGGDGKWPAADPVETGEDRSAEDGTGAETGALGERGEDGEVQPTAELLEPALEVRTGPGRGDARENQCGFGECGPVVRV